MTDLATIQQQKPQELGVDLATLEESPTKEIAKSIVLGAAQGIANLPIGIQNLLARGFQALPQPVQQIEKRLPIPTRQVQPFTFAERTPHPTVAKVAESISPLLLPTGEVTGAVKGAEALSKTVPQLGRGLLGLLTRGTARAAELGTTGAATAGIFAAEDPRSKLAPAMLAGGVGAAGLGGLLSSLGIAGRGALALAGRKVPGISQISRPFVSDEIENMRQRLTGGEDTSIADRTLFDRIARKYDELEGHAVDLKGNPITPETAIYHAPEQSISADYQKLNDEWNKLGEPEYNRKAYDNAIEEEANKAKKGLSQYEDTALLKKPKEELVDNLEDFKNIKLNNFEDADNLKKDINQVIGSIPSATATPEEKALRRSLHNINEGIRQTVKDTATKNPQLAAQWQRADTRFKNEIVPFRSIGKRGISPFYKMYLEGGANVDNLVKSYIKPGQNDLLENFIKILPDNESKDLSTAAFMRGTENNPEAFLRRYRGLSDKQKSLLFSNDKKRLDQLAKVTPSVTKKLPAQTVKAAAATAAAFPELAKFLKAAETPITSIFQQPTINEK